MLSIRCSCGSGRETSSIVFWNQPLLCKACGMRHPRPDRTDYDESFIEKDGIAALIEIYLRRGRSISESEAEKILAELKAMAERGELDHLIDFTS